MKKILAMVLALLLALSMAACGDKNSEDSADEQQVESTVPADDGVVTKEQYVAGVKFVKENADKTYEEVAEAFGEGGAKTLDENWSDSYHYYSWTDGTRTFIVTFTVNNGTEIATYFTGDINV